MFSFVKCFVPSTFNFMETFVKKTVAANHGKSPKITENHGKQRKITDGFFESNHGWMRIPGCWQDSVNRRRLKLNRLRWALNQRQLMAR